MKDDSGIHHLTVPGMVETPSHSSSHATIMVYENYVKVVGYSGRVPDVDLPFHRVVDETPEGGMLDEIVDGIKSLGGRGKKKRKMKTILPGTSMADVEPASGMVSGGQIIQAAPGGVGMNGFGGGQDMNGLPNQMGNVGSQMSLLGGQAQSMNGQGMGIQGMGIQGMGVQGMGVQGMGVPQVTGMNGMGPGGQMTNGIGMNTQMNGLGNSMTNFCAPQMPDMSHHHDDYHHHHLDHTDPLDVGMGHHLHPNIDQITHMNTMANAARQPAEMIPTPDGRHPDPFDKFGVTSASMPNLNYQIEDPHNHIASHIHQEPRHQHNPDGTLPGHQLNDLVGPGYYHEAPVTSRGRGSLRHHGQDSTNIVVPFGEDRAIEVRERPTYDDGECVMVRESD